MSVTVEEDTFCRWNCDFVAAHAIFGTGLITVPVAGVHLVNNPHSAPALFFAMFAVFFTTISLILCCRFYSELKRPPWPLALGVWRPAAAAGRRRPRIGGERRDAGGVARPPAPRAAGDGPRGDAGRPRRGPHTELRLRAPGRRRRLRGVPGRGGEGGDGAAAAGVPARVPPGVFDLWLQAHATCPICRSAVLPARPERLPEVVVDIGAGHGQPSITTSM